MHKSSYCGINCEKCKAYIATVNNDDTLKSEVAVEWGALYKQEFTNEDIVCYGCKSNTLFVLCSLCDIPVCCKEHGVSICSECELFPCERIQSFYDFQREKGTLDMFDYEVAF